MKNPISVMTINREKGSIQVWRYNGHNVYGSVHRYELTEARVKDLKSRARQQNSYSVRSEFIKRLDLRFQDHSTEGLVAHAIYLIKCGVSRERAIDHLTSDWKVHPDLAEAVFQNAEEIEDGRGGGEAPETPEIMEVSTRYVITDTPSLISPVGYKSTQPVYLQTRIAIQCDEIPATLPKTNGPLYLHDVQAIITKAGQPLPRTDISDFKDHEKTARALFDAQFPRENGYLQNIQRAAHILLGFGHETALYVTQYGNGNSLWILHPGTVVFEKRVIVDIEEGKFE